MVKAIQEGKTLVQRLSDLVAWFLQDRGVQLTFEYSPKAQGKMCPDFLHQYWVDGRLCTERCMAMQIMSALRERNYNYTLAQTISALQTHTWHWFVQHQDYPDWMREEHTPPPLRRPVGRPRKHPLKLPVPEAPVPELRGWDLEDPHDRAVATAAYQDATEDLRLSEHHEP